MRQVPRSWASLPRCVCSISRVRPRWPATREHPTHARAARRRSNFALSDNLALAARGLRNPQQLAAFTRLTTLGYRIGVFGGWGRPEFGALCVSMRLTNFGKWTASNGPAQRAGAVRLKFREAAPTDVGPELSCWAILLNSRKCKSCS